MPFRIFRKTPVFSAPGPVNSPGNVNRVNRHRKWLTKARPKQIQHVVYLSPDFERSFAFYRDRLNFRLSDYQKTFGIFSRCDGTMDHHNLYFLNSKFRCRTSTASSRFSHVNYIVEDVDEVMVGANHMERRGWAKSNWGLGRHRIASALFNYLPCPAGGEAEYGADSDMIDDGWVPRVWHPLFGTAIFMHNLQPWIKEAPPWDVQLAPGYTPQGSSGPPPANGGPVANGAPAEVALEQQSVPETAH